ncbi:MAG TPA: hypothetical protein VIN40_09205 [Candidatus Tyrphobacter sp.]
MRIPLLHNRWFVVILAVTVSAADAYANAHHQSWGDWLATGLFGAYAAYCAQNFLHCREIHCAITAPGFLAAAALMALQATGIAHYGYGLPWLVFVASACAGYCVEWLYERRTGSVFLER